VTAIVIFSKVVFGIDCAGIIFTACCLRWGFPPWRGK
jgi:hypothetical protein